MFAHRPAPVLATWLGFWGTTGLSAMDYILSDEVTIPQGEEGFYSERVLRLPQGRFCYGPPDYAPEPTPPPCRRRDTVTFGSFNNLAKIGPEVVRLWASVLRATPGSRLLLKWKSLADSGNLSRMAAAFGQCGIGADRLILRRASPHVEMLAEYGEMDIALDPFPFSGGLTSCEAMWMGVPIVTMPGSAPPSRQTLGFLKVLGLSQWAATSVEDYVRIATTLAADIDGLTVWRRELRSRMKASPLCDGPAFTRELEAVLRTIWRNWCA
jgi:predicted O-linked N-acetylglucosamine transferase (SPINDLY family)